MNKNNLKINKLSTMSVVKQSIITAVCIALCVVLPMAFHSIPQAGMIYCPMHIPVLICIEQGGSNVSGGQKQRLCIARALLKKPKILILDDSTSAVDTATDAKIRKAFLEEIPATTKLIIAQRISSVQDADRIIVMDDGKVNGIGTHEELLKSNEIYREVYESQTGGGGDFDEKRGEA